MLSNVLDKISFWSLFVVIVVLPIFVIPFSHLQVETSKSLLLVLGLSVSFIFWSAARFSDGKVVIPKSWLLLSGFGVVLSFLISSIASSASKVSFFGAMFDIGTFWFVFSGFMLMFLASLIIKEEKKAKMVLSGVVLSTAVVMLFQVFRFFAPQTLSLGVLGGSTGNLLGSWNSFGVFIGLITILSLFAIEFMNFSKTKKILLGSFIAFSVIMAAIVNFHLVWEMLGVFALIIFVYKISIAPRGEDNKKSYFPAFSFGVVMVSLLFFMSGQFIGGYLPQKFGAIEIEISPSLPSTMSVSMEALKKDPILGIGPNRFGEVWSSYKPQGINATQFWNSYFSSGSGLLPSFVATNGVLGVIAWLALIVLLVYVGVKKFFESIKKKEVSKVIIFFVASLYLLIASFFYSSGFVVFFTTFAFIGVFVGLINKNRENGEYTISFLEDPRKSFFSILFLVLIMIASAGIAFKFMERFASAYYFQKAVTASDLDTAELSINRALALRSNDLYLRSYAEIYLARLTSLVIKEGDLSDEEKTQLQFALEQSVDGAKLATEYNDKNYLNFQTLGSIYHSTGLYGAPDSFENAIDAYNKASELNPLNPSLKLSISTVYLAENKLKEAKEAALEALNLKPNYVDALIILSRIEKDSGNNSEAVGYAEQALYLLPGSEELRAYVNSLKSGAPATAPKISEDQEKEVR